MVFKHYTLRGEKKTRAPRYRENDGVPLLLYLKEKKKKKKKRRKESQSQLPFSSVLIVKTVAPQLHPLRINSKSNLKMFFLQKCVYWGFKKIFRNQLDTEVNIFIFLNLNYLFKDLSYLFHILKVKISTSRFIQFFLF